MAEECLLRTGLNRLCNSCGLGNGAALYQGYLCVRDEVAGLFSSGTNLSIMRPARGNNRQDGDGGLTTFVALRTPASLRAGIGGLGTEQEDWGAGEVIAGAGGAGSGRGFHRLRPSGGQLQDRLLGQQEEDRADEVKAGQDEEGVFVGALHIPHVACQRARDQE